MEETHMLDLMAQEIEFYYLDDPVLMGRILETHSDSWWLVNMEDDRSRGFLETHNINNWILASDTMILPRLVPLCNSLATLDAYPAPFVNQCLVNVVILTQDWDNLKRCTLEPIDLAAVRGKRQFTRLNCDRDDNIVFFIKIGITEYKGRISDISIAGAALRFRDNPNLKEGTRLDNVYLNLGLFHCHVSGQVIRSSGNIIVMFFTNNSFNQQGKEAIHKFMFHYRQKHKAGFLLPDSGETGDNPAEKPDRTDPVENDIKELFGLNP
jgi:hypothetical protein